MRQRDPDRYRGKRRAPSPPRTRYATVLTIAVFGAGAVALTARAALPDDAPFDFRIANETVGDISGLKATEDRFTKVDDHTARSYGRPTASTMSTMSLPAPDVWLLPLADYRLSSPFGKRGGTIHPGVDLAVAAGTPYYATHAGTVTLARWCGGYGYCMIVDNGNGVETMYGHSSKLIAHEGQKVAAGDVLGLVGDTGYSRGSLLHFEVRVDDRPTDPVPFMRSHGVDIFTTSFLCAESFLGIETSTAAWRCEARP